MKKFYCLFFIFLLGCSGTEENASANLKKGDDFFAKKEYEVAEYYYEKIPEESPIYIQAQKKLEEIAAVKKQWADKEVKVGDLTKIIVLDHTYQTDNVSQVPIHRLSLVNNTDRFIETITVEFTYFDKSGKEITKLTAEVNTPMYQNTQDVFKGISPGMVNEEYAKSTAKIISARFQ